MNLDGTERTVIYNTAEFMQANKFRNVLMPSIINGVLFFMPSTIKDGVTNLNNAYYKFDVSMDEAKTKTMFNLFLFADGVNFIATIYEEEGDTFTYCLWDPNEGIIKELFTTDLDHLSPYAYGYVGTNASYYVENGIIFEDSYTEGKKELINTGHKGDFQLACFPDCIVMYDKGEPVFEKNTFLYFYDWDYNDLGSVKIDYPFDEGLVGFVCGETPERIILTDNDSGSPCYYINKSDLGTGNIEIHTFKLPDFGEDYFWSDEGDED